MMIFNYKKWDDFCRILYDSGMISIPACEVNGYKQRYIVLKHDVETNVPRSFELARIEHKYGHKGSYYVQAYLMKNEHNVELLKQMQRMGHEISYHYDVMDSQKGNLDKAIIEFEENKKLFEDNGFPIVTVCQHGNPVVERVGYTSNRDYFRSDRVRALYPGIVDIMVNFKSKYQTEYSYYSDAGRKFKLIYDPLNNDLVNSDDKNIEYENLMEVFTAIQDGNNVILSTHPHRWCKSVIEYAFKNGLFRIVKSAAKLLLHIPGMRRIMGRFYYLAKKI